MDHRRQQPHGQGFPYSAELAPASLLGPDAVLALNRVPGSHACLPGLERIDLSHAILRSIVRVDAGDLVDDGNLSFQIGAEHFEKPPIRAESWKNGVVYGHEGVELVSAEQRARHLDKVGIP